MIEPVVPKYQWGQRVQATLDLYNDGSYPELPEEALIAPLGTVGEIVQIGTHTELNVAVYIVEFDAKRVVGCLEDEIGPIPG